MRLLAVFALVLASCSVEQVAHPKPPPSQPLTSAGLAPQDRDFLERAAQGNKAEVAIAALVDGRASSTAVIEFGHMMVADHSGAQKRLAEVARQLSIAIPTSLGENQIGYDRLVERKGHPFDTEFTKVMIEDHQKAVQLYESILSNGVEPRIRAYAAETLPRIKAHLDRVTEMAKTRR